MTLICLELALRSTLLTSAHRAGVFIMELGCGFTMPQANVTFPVVPAQQHHQQKQHTARTSALWCPHTSTALRSTDLQAENFTCYGQMCAGGRVNYLLSNVCVTTQIISSPPRLVKLLLSTDSESGNLWLQLQKRGHWKFIKIVHINL